VKKHRWDGIDVNGPMDQGARPSATWTLQRRLAST